MAELTASEKGGKRGLSKKLHPRIDFTAMVDLAFLLITFFILTTSLAKPHIMKLEMPPKNVPPGPEAASRTMTICLGKGNTVLWYLGLPDRPLVQPTMVNYGKNGLRAAIVTTEKRVKKTTGKELIVILKPSDHSVYDNLISSLDELNITSVQYYAIADISPADIKMLQQKNAY
ncbi:MAG TPA: biopolymer transporter ExbD [Mucilaginibacter sp.]|jgi:biopolymer transport protein ExbD|nr:biopolymer transporter ExbD [Mucilaginibacter sp.]